jgi:hypothetical protein
MSIDMIKKFWDKLSRRHDNLGRDDSFYAIFSNGFNKANIKIDHLTKVVVRECDEECLKRIEDGLVALDIITRAPKQFLKTDFEIIPVELAKKTGTASIKHLSSHSHLISRVDEDGMVVPTRILTGLADDNIALYENIFVKSLIVNLVTFFDRRFSELLDDVDFSSLTALKNKSSFNVKNSKVDFEMKLDIITDNFNKDDIMKMDEILRRVSWIKRTLGRVYSSQFMRTLADCRPIVGAIKRTNIITKEPNYNICYHLWNYISNYEGMVLDFRIEQIPIELNDKYRKKMNKAMMYMYAAVDACQKDNEKYNEALKKSLNLVIKKSKIQKIKRVMDNNETVEIENENDPYIFGEEKQKTLEMLIKEKEYLKEQLSITKEKNRQKEIELREIEKEKQEYIRLKQQEIDDLLKQRSESRKEMMRRARINKEKEIIAQEAKAVKKIRDRKYVVEARIREMESRIKICNSNIEKSGGTIFMLTQEINNKVNVIENKKEIKEIKKNQITWKETIAKCKKKIKDYEAKVKEIDSKVEQLNKINKEKRAKRKKILIEKNSR